MSVQRFRIQGLTCADCAERIERAAGGLPGVQSARAERQEGRRKIQLLLSIALFASGFLLSEPLRMPAFLLAYLASGAEVIWRALRGVAARRPLDESVLMTIATAGAWILAEPAEAAAVMVFYRLGDTLQALAVNRSRRSVAALLDLRPRSVRVLRAHQGEEREEVVDPAAIEPGDVVVSRPGERIPVDGIVLRGSGSLDTSALTGESLPRPVSEGVRVQAGAIVIDARLLVLAEAKEEESTVARMLALVEEAAERKAPAERLMSRLARVYTPLVVGAAALLALLPPLLGLGPSTLWVYRALVFLVVSCPCALVVSMPLGYFAGIGAASRQGILVKGGQFLDSLVRVTTVVFDKTGTVTTGRFRVTGVYPRADSHAPAAQELVALAYRAAHRSSHPVSRAVTAWCVENVSTGRADVLAADFLSDEVREAGGRGVIVTTTEGRIVAGSRTHLLEQGIVLPGDATGQLAGTAMYIARDDRYVGCFSVADEIRSGTHDAIRALRRQGVEHIVLLSGDTEAAARSVGREIGADLVRGGLLPEDKVREVESLIHGHPGGGGTLFVGDGINDAAVIARADVGIAMGGIGSDAAVEAADIVLMRDDPALVPTALAGARRVRRIVMQNVVFALGTKAVFLLAASLGLATMWMAVFADVGVTVLTVLNTLRILAVAHWTER